VSALKHGHDVKYLQQLCPLLDGLGWAWNNETVAYAPFDLAAWRGDRAVAIQFKSRTPDQVQSDSVSISASAMERYEKLVKEHADAEFEMVLVSDDMKVDTLAHAVKNSVYYGVGGYYFVDTRPNRRTSTARVPLKFTVQEYFS